MDQAFADRSATLAANQGLYNGFLAAGLVWGLLAADPIGFQVKVFFLACVVVAGLYGAATVSRRILVVQALPAVLALAAVLARGQPRLTVADSQPALRPVSGTNGSSVDDSPLEESRRDDATTPTSPPPTAPFDPDDDDRLIGRVLSRREVLALMGAASVRRSWPRLCAAVEPASGVPGSQRGSRALPASDGSRPPAAADASALPVLRRRPGAHRGPVLRR